MYIKKRVIFLAVLGLFLIFGCAKPVKETKKTTLPPVETVGEEPPSSEEVDEYKTVEKTKIEAEDIMGDVEKKTYPGIEGEFYEPLELRDCHFDFDKYNLTPEAIKILSENAEILKKLPNSKIQIEGHCDERGTNEYNLALGERRASSVKTYLISLGITQMHISTISYGEEMPIDPGHNEEAWTKNRRAHIIILSKD